ncbi:MAG: LysM peptidoglycan-binding domain-containing protein, partial [Candidatus Latescibacteria bacterium]|nr:LysM peptidoglycan-binding domain-containing protein [Candidatus Latescibacterota bacterium]
LAEKEGSEEGMRIHIVQRGDTLSGIARRYGVPLASLYRINGLGPRSVLRPGQQIITRAR